MTDEPMDKLSNDAESLRLLRASLDDLERRRRAVSAPAVRHDVGNGIGAARNALELFEDDPGAASAARFIQIARRNVERVAELLKQGASAVDDAPSSDRSGRNERNDLGGAGEREHGDTLGL